MKEKRATNGLVLYADYVVPVYNLNSDVRHLRSYSNDEVWVDVWAARAKLGDEYKSMQASMRRAENKYCAALRNAPDNEELRMNMIGIQSVREFFSDPKYHNVIDNELKLAVARYLRERQLKTDLDHAKYLVGFSYFNLVKEAMR